MVSLLVSSSAAQAADLGIIGHTYEIEETDMLDSIGNKLSNLEKSGKLNDLNKQMQEKAKAYVMRPPAIKLNKATKERIFYYEPVYVLKEDLVGADDIVFYPKDTRINSLDLIGLSYVLLIIDGDDPAQLKWAINKTSKQLMPCKIILINGHIGELTKKYQVQFYFDQEGLITSKLGIKHVPAIVTQEGKVLRIAEELVQ